MAQRGRKPKHHHELHRIQEEIARIQARVDEIKAEGAKVELVNAALANLGTDVDALIAKPGGITQAEAQTIADAINAIDAKVKAALTPAA